MYGRGIEYSLLLESATKTIPAQGQVALFNLSWDGGNTGEANLHLRFETSICVLQPVFVYLLYLCW